MMHFFLYYLQMQIKYFDNISCVCELNSTTRTKEGKDVLVNCFCQVFYRNLQNFYGFQDILMDSI